MDELGLTLLLVFAAELGDKSQVMAFTFGARYRAIPILAAIAVAAAVLQGLSVLAGTLLDAALPTRTITLVAGLAFVAFAVWSFLEARRDPYDDPASLDEPSRGAVLGAAVAFFLAELGDKTMLATVTLAARQNALATWAGATLGMVIADGLALWAGSAIGSRLNRRLVRALSGVAFAVFGILLLIEAGRG